MPNARKLYILATLRQTAGVTLAEMARACGLSGSRAYESASAWERGKSVPHSRLRPKFIEYLVQTLGLQHDLDQLRNVWDVLVEEWGWEPLDDLEWRQCTAIPPQEEPALNAAASISVNVALAEALAQLERMPSAEILVAPATLPPGSRMPFSRNPLFVGRLADLHALAAVLKGDQTAAIGSVEIAAASGLGGIGKTQLAVEFVHRYGQFFDGGVFWLSFADANAVPAEIAACGGAGHLALRPDFEQLPVNQQVRLVRDAWESRIPRLLIFDNCEDPALLERWRPASGGCRVLLTSRRSQWDASLGVRTLLLGVFSRSESVALLHKHCPDLSANDVQLTAIAAELDDLPLALHLAGHYLARYRPEVSPAAYVHQLRSPKLLDHPSLQAGGVSPTGHDQHVARTFALSYDRLDPSNQTDRSALALLARAAYFAPGEPIPRNLLLATVNEADTDTPSISIIEAEIALARLIELGLLEVVGDDRQAALRMHRLLVAFVRQISQDAAAQAAVELCLLLAAQRLNAATAHMELLALQPHLRAVTDAGLAGSNERTAALCYELSQHLAEIEDYADAVRYNEHALAIRSAILGAEHPGIVDNLNHMGWILHMQWRYAEAQPYHERALAICTETLGENHPTTAESLNYLGAALHAQDQYSHAQIYYQQALAIRERILGEDHNDTAQSLNNLGLLLHAAGQYAEALQYHRRALTIRERVLGPDHLKLAFTLNNLGYLLRAMARYSEARPYLERALAIRERRLGPNNTYVAGTLNHIGRLLQYAGDYAGAQQYLERALSIYDQAFGVDNLYTGHSVGNLGMLFYDQGAYVVARPYLERALMIHQQALGESDRHTARSLNHLGILLHTVGDLVAARPLLERALAIRVQVLGNKHPDSANSLGNLGMLLLDESDVVTARQYLEHALAIHRDVLGDKHPYTARSLLRIGRLCYAEGAYAAARLHLKQAFLIYQQVLGATHPYTTSCFEHLVRIHPNVRTG